jgi:hypothetical protein
MRHRRHVPPLILYKNSIGIFSLSAVAHEFASLLHYTLPLKMAGIDEFMEICNIGDPDAIRKAWDSRVRSDSVLRPQHTPRHR